MSSPRTATADSDSDSENDWEEVDVPQPEQQHLEITINERPKRDDSAKSRPSSYTLDALNLPLI
jgi:hypothetical protein